MKTEYSKSKGLIGVAEGNSFSLSHAKPSLRSQGSISIAVNAAFTTAESFKLTDTSGRSVTFKFDTGVVTVDGSVDANGNVIVGTQGAAAGTAQIVRLISAINAVTSFNQATQGDPKPEGQANLSLDIAAGIGSADELTCSLIQTTAGTLGNRVIETFVANGDADDLTGVTKANFTGGKDGDTAETATGIHYLVEEVSIDQSVLGADNLLLENDVAVQLSHKLPSNSVILRASLTQTSASADVPADSGDYGVVISPTSTNVGDEKAGGSVVIANTVATGLNLSGTTAASGIQAVANKQFIQLFPAGAAANAETGIVKLLVAIQYAGMGEPIKI